jgi:hypothetical protein
LGEIEYELSWKPELFLVFIYIFFNFASLKIICTKFDQPLNITFFSKINVLFRGKKRGIINFLVLPQWSRHYVSTW